MEIYVGIIVGCVPIFPTLLRQTSVAATVAKIFSSVRWKSSRTDISTAAQDNDPLEQYGESTEVLTLGPLYHFLPEATSTFNNERTGDIEYGKFRTMDREMISIGGDLAREQ